ncbi:MAG: DMT family transporter [Candidatus Limnocylindrales bacterium]
MIPAGVGFGVGAAISWGSGDYGGGLASRRATPLATVVLSQAIGLPIAAAMTVIVGERIPGTGSLAWAMVGGASGFVTLVCLYRGLATRAMGPVSAIATIVGVGLPVMAGTLTGDRLRPQDIAGIALALLAIVLVTRPTGSLRIDRNGLGLALVAGMGSGGFFIAMGQSADAAGETWWPLVASRLASIGLAVLMTLALRQAGPTFHSLSPLMAFVGLADMLGTVCFLLAASQGSLSLAAVTSSQYPVVTTILAHAFLGQRLERAHVAGIGLALVGIAMFTVS